MIKINLKIKILKTEKNLFEYKIMMIRISKLIRKKTSVRIEKKV